MGILKSIRNMLLGGINSAENILPEKKWQRPSASEDLPADVVAFIQTEGKCPYCKSEYGLYQGPRGGMAINLFCGNPDCNSRFNVAGVTGLPWGQFTGECPPDFLAQRRKEIEEST